MFSIDDNSQVDFGSSREISGVRSMGVAGVGWVEALTVGYSVDGHQWNMVLGRDGRTPRVFPANYDGTSSVTQYLERVVEARYVRLTPTRWHGSIGLKLEILGCYEPYPPPTPPSPAPLPGQQPEEPGSCTSCPGLSPAPTSCSCPPGALYDGARCVQLKECPCYVGQSR